MNWISIDKELPELWQKVLVYIDGFVFTAERNESTWALYGTSFRIGSTMKITHWMPLPENPLTTE